MLGSVTLHQSLQNFRLVKSSLQLKEMNLGSDARGLRLLFNICDLFKTRDKV